MKRFTTLDEIGAALTVLTIGVIAADSFGWNEPITGNLADVLCVVLLALIVVSHVQRRRRQTRDLVS